MRNSLKALIAVAPATLLVACVIRTGEPDTPPPPPPPPATATATTPAPTATTPAPATTTTTTEAPIARPVGVKAAGKPCTSGADCASGECEGGCGDGEGLCTKKLRRCFKDAKQYCGCDDVTFEGSSTCPGRRYKHQGACEAAK